MAITDRPWEYIIRVEKFVIKMAGTLNSESKLNTENNDSLAHCYNMSNGRVAFSFCRLTASLFNLVSRRTYIQDGRQFSFMHVVLRFNGI